MSVRERFIQLLEDKKFSQAQFSKASGYTANAVNKFLTGRTTSPKQDFFEAVKKAWPDVNLNWLIVGEGPVYLDKKKNLFFKGELPEAKTVEEMVKYKGPKYEDLEVSNKNSPEYVTKEDFDNTYRMLNKLLLYLIRNELLPGYEDQESAEELRELLKGM